MFHPLADELKALLDEDLKTMRESPPGNPQERAARRARLERLLDTSAVQGYLETAARRSRHCLARILTVLFGPDPRIKRFAAVNDS